MILNSDTTIPFYETLNSIQLKAQLKKKADVKIKKKIKTGSFFLKCLCGHLAIGQKTNRFYYTFFFAAFNFGFFFLFYILQFRI